METTTNKTKGNYDDDINLFYGLTIPNIAGFTFIYLSKLLNDRIDQGGLFVFSDFFLVPLLIGIFSAWFWRNSGLKNREYLFRSLLNTCIAIVIAGLFLREGLICLLIILPVIWGMMVAGAFIGKAMFRSKKNTLRSSIFGIIFLLFIVDGFTKHEYVNKVSDTILINAPVNKVWPLVLEYDPIKTKEHYWLFKIGMPSPVQSTVDGHCAGAGRKCIFSNGYTFDEKMVVYEPGKELTFDIVNQPRDPEIMGHIDILRGQFILKDNGDGTTTLTGNSWYQLHVFPSWYFDLWAKSITRNVHVRVMEYIKILSEKNV